MRLVRALLLFGVAIGLVTLAGFVLTGTPLAVPTAIAGVGSFLLAIG